MKVYFRALVLIGLFIAVVRTPAEAASTNIVISQLYLGTGGFESKPRSQYIELFNRGTTTINLQTWTLQYATEDTNTWQPFALSGSLAPGQYYLIRAANTSGLVNLPQTDLTISLTLPLNVGKLAVVSDTAALDSGCPTDTKVADRVGYGSTACPESRSLDPVGDTLLLAYLRKGGGCIDSDINFLDFSAVSPLPRNSSSARNFCGATSGTKGFSIAAGGATSFQSAGTGPAINVGYARVQTDAAGQAPTGVAIFGLSQGGTLVSEAGVPVSRLVTGGLIYVEISGAANTGIAIANPNNEDVTIDYTVTDSNNVQSYITGSAIISGNSQVARFLTELPFAIRPVVGTLTFRASVPIAVTALRGFTNERGEFLVSTLPVVDLTVPAATTPSYLPNFAVGGGWRTELVLVNTSDIAISGSIAFFDQAGNSTSVPVGTTTTSSVDYLVAARRTLKFLLPNTGSTIQTGTVRVTPLAGDRTPVPLGIFSYNLGGVRVSEATLAALRGNQLRTYIENSGIQGSLGSIQSGFAIANASASTATVNIEAFRLDGTSTGLTTSVTIPVSGKTAKFTSEIFPSLPNPFKGTMKLTSTAAISVVGLRGRYNQRGDFLITTLPPSEEVTLGSSSEVIFPHIVDGGGYTTQFILFSGAAIQTSSGTVLFRATGGQRFDLTVQ
ncbi:MAG TPA: lamin tail domain-containing protein [Terriglobia bacterium]|nr:lamin tail domain-containing protein [Terriglobia bacterium]